MWGFSTTTEGKRLLRELISSFIRNKRDGDKTQMQGVFEREKQFQLLNSGNRHTNQCALTHAFTTLICAHMHMHTCMTAFSEQSNSVICFIVSLSSLNMHQSSSIYYVGNCCFGVKCTRQTKIKKMCNNNNNNNETTKLKRIIQCKTYKNFEGWYVLCIECVLWGFQCSNRIYIRMCRPNFAFTIMYQLLCSQFCLQCSSDSIWNQCDKTQHFILCHFHK